VAPAWRIPTHTLYNEAAESVVFGQLFHISVAGRYTHADASTASSVLTLKSASPQTYRPADQTISYSFNNTNTGDPGSARSRSNDPKLGAPFVRILNTIIQQVKSIHYGL
jgi:hypothetical protein